MKALHLAAIGMSLSVSTGSAAQTISAQPARTITSVGCVSRAPQNGSLAASPGVPPAPPNRADTLANSVTPSSTLILNGATAPDATDEVRKQAAAGRLSTAPLATYVLDGASADIDRHVGHQVEVTGLLRIVDTQGPMASHIAHIEVRAVRSLAATCPQLPASREKQ
jgi:hypothetical protein